MRLTIQSKNIRILINKLNLVNKKVIILIIFSVVFLSCAIVCGLTFYGATKLSGELEAEEFRIESDRIEKLEDLEKEYERSIDLYDCNQLAQDSYTNRWNIACASNGQSEKCSLPSDIASILEDSKQEALNRCVELYK